MHQAALPASWHQQQSQTAGGSKSSSTVMDQLVVVLVSNQSRVHSVSRAPLLALLQALMLVHRETACLLSGAVQMSCTPSCQYAAGS